MKYRPFVLVICDGWGQTDETFGNAIAAAGTPHLDKLTRKWPHTSVAASGEAVGLPDGQQGNSEVGHLTIGAGRIIRQALTRQHHEIATGSFYENETLITAIELTKSRGTSLHVMGLVSPGGVHSHQDGAVATAKLAASLGLNRVHVHAFTDGRDTPPTSAQEHLAKFEKDLETVGVGRVASISGRYYAMDRDNRWERTRKAYDMLTAETHPTHSSSSGYIQERYDQGENDEFLTPVSIAASSQDRVRLEDGDVVIFFNFRPDRARQLSHALVDADFTEFKRGRTVHNLHLVTFGEYDRALDAPVAFPKDDISENLADIVSRHNLKQFHIAETEKYAHITYFINGGRESAYPGEDRQLIASPKVATYDLAPAMSAKEVTAAVIKRIHSGTDDLIIVNYANADMVGHTGDFEATKTAIKIVDECLGALAAATLKMGGVMLVTADHGNAEYKIDRESHKPLTAHTTSAVPVILCGTNAKSLHTGGGLQDIAPTVLHVMGLETPNAMTGTSLVSE
ncbi:MAG TPA: 2,3-bisphosphoglycerate-independent phosphoglycerate mutase [Candidatus Saccharimonadia bacterium]|nr:2,3-bisphosphoglycerate-independent phosphoglycerate mutase [Candidatus Saccharimonadia bacterium]